MLACQEDSQLWLEELSRFPDSRYNLVGEEWKNLNSSLLGDTVTPLKPQSKAALGPSAAPNSELITTFAQSSLQIEPQA